MNVETVISSCLSLAGIWFLLFWLYKDFCVDYFREQLFAVRDGMFHAAVNGEISFDDKMYGLVRFTINGFIRFGHELDLVSFLAIFLIGRPKYEYSNGFAEKMKEAKTELTPEKLRKYEECMGRVNIVVVRHVLVSAPILAITILVPIATFVLSSFCGKQILSLLKIPFARADAVAYVAGEARFSV